MILLISKKVEDYQYDQEAKKTENLPYLKESMITIKI